MASIANEFSSESASLHGYKLYAVVGIGVGTLIILLVFSILLWIHYRKKAIKDTSMKLPIDNLSSINHHRQSVGALEKATFKKPVEQSNTSSSSTVSEDRTIEKTVVHIRDHSVGVPSSEGSIKASSDTDVGKPSSDKPPINKTQAAIDFTGYASTSTEQIERSLSLSLSAPSPPMSSHGPEPGHFGWGHWYTLRELEVATNYFSNENIVGRGGYGIVYHGILGDGSSIAVKNLVNNRGQAEREFKVEVEAIGRVRHKNLVRLLGYCMEGVQRMLVYEFIDNGNLDQWLHGSLGENKRIPWDTRMKIIIGTAKGLAYLHEGLEPKVVHRDVKASNILLDSDWNPRISDFGLAKLLGSENSHVTTRVMGTFGYVAPEYASTGLLNEKSDVYSYGVLLMEMITGRDPVDYSRPQGEVNLVDWLKMMVGKRRSDEVADPKMESRPSMRSLKRALLVSLKCVDPDAQKRPKMSQVIHMLEMDDNPFHTEKGSHIGRNPRHFQSNLRNQGFPLDHGASSYQHSPRSKNRDARSVRHMPCSDSDTDREAGSGKPRWRKYEA